MRLIALLLAVLAPLSVAASAKVVVDFAAPAGASHWFVDSLAELVGGELARFQRLAVIDTLDTHACNPLGSRERSQACVLDLYRARGVDIVVLGALNGERLEYEVHATSTASRATRGSLNVAGASRARLQQQLGDIVRPVVQLADLVVQKPQTTAPVVSAAPGTSPGFAMLFLATLALIVCWPMLVLVVLFRRRAFALRPPSWRWTAAVIALSGFGVGLLQLGWGREAVALAGGVLWGAFVLAQVVWVFAPIEGLSRIRHDALLPLLKHWLAFVSLRASLLLFYLPLLIVCLQAAQLARVDEWLTWVVVVPAVGLLAVFCFLGLVDNLAVWLDQTLVIGHPNARNPWHATIRRYFIGYLRRSGSSLNRKVLERALFLPGKLPGVVVYGGGFAQPRILVGMPTLELALGELPDEPEAPERTVNPEELPWGFLVPGSDERDAATTPTWLRQANTADLRRRTLVRAAPRPYEPKPRLIGESATALGWVVPLPRDETLPLISNSKEDFDVVKSLLSEHYAAFESGLEDDVDDTDPTEKDFLYGALVGAIGSFTRADGLVATIALAIAGGRGKASKATQRVISFAEAVHARFLSMPAAAVADGYAALNLALHPAIQYLHHLRGGDPSIHTARADSPKLLSTSKRIFELLATVPAAKTDQQALTATHANRLRAMATYFSASASAAAPMPRRHRVVRNAIIALLLLSLGAAAAVDALQYHPAYEERMSQMQQKATAVSGGSDVRTEQTR